MKKPYIYPHKQSTKKKKQSNNGKHSIPQDQPNCSQILNHFRQIPSHLKNTQSHPIRSNKIQSLQNYLQFQEKDYGKNKISYRIKPSRLKTYESKVQMDDMNQQTYQPLPTQHHSLHQLSSQKNNHSYSRINQQNLDRRLQKTILEFKSFYTNSQQCPLLPLRLLSLIQKYGITKINRTSFYEFMDVPSIDYSRKELNVWLNTTKKDFMDWQKYGGSLMNYYSGNDGTQITFNQIMKYKGVLGPTQRKKRKQENQNPDQKIVLSEAQANRIGLFKFQKIVVPDVKTQPNKLDYLKRWFNVFEPQNLQRFQSVYRLEFEMLQDYKKNEYIQIRGQLTFQELQQAKNLELFMFAVRTAMSGVFKDNFFQNFKTSSNFQQKETQLFSILTTQQSQDHFVYNEERKDRKYKTQSFISSNQEFRRIKEYFNCSVIRFRSVVRSFVRNLVKVAEYYVEKRLNQYVKPITGRQIDIMLSPFLNQAKEDSKRNVFSPLTFIGKKLLILVYGLSPDPQPVSDEEILNFYNQVLEILFNNEKQKLQSKKSNLPCFYFEVRHIPYKQNQQELTLSQCSIEYEIYSQNYQVKDIFDLSKPNLRGYDWTQIFEQVMLKLFVKMKSLKKIRNFWYQKFKTQLFVIPFDTDQQPVRQIIAFTQNQQASKTNDIKTKRSNKKILKKQTELKTQSKKLKNENKNQKTQNKKLKKIKKEIKKPNKDKPKVVRNLQNVNLSQRQFQSDQNQGRFNCEQESINQGTQNKSQRDSLTPQKDSCDYQSQSESHQQSLSTEQNSAKNFSNQKSAKEFVCRYFRYASIKHNFKVLHRKVLQEVQEIFHYLVLVSKMTNVSFAIKKFLFLNRDQKICILTHMEGLKIMLMIDEFWIRWKQRQKYQTLNERKNKNLNKKQDEKRTETAQRMRHKQWWTKYATVRKNASQNHQSHQIYLPQQDLNQDPKQSFRPELEYPLLYLTYISECILEYLETKRHIRGILIQDQKEKLKNYNLFQVIQGKVFKNSSQSQEKDIVSWKNMQYNQLQQQPIRIGNEIPNSSKNSLNKTYVLYD